MTDGESPDDGALPTERRAAPRTRTPPGERARPANAPGVRRKAAPKPRKAQAAPVTSVADRIDPLMHAAAAVEVAAAARPASNKARPALFEQNRPVETKPTPPRRPAAPRKRAPSQRPVEALPVARDRIDEIAEEAPTSELAVFDDLLVFDEPVIEKADPVVDDRVVAKPDKPTRDLDFFDDLDFEQRVVQKPVVEEPVVQEPVVERPPVHEPVVHETVVEERVPYVLPTIVPAEPEVEPEAEPVADVSPSGLVIAEPKSKRTSPKFKLPASFKPQFKGVTKTLRRKLQPVVLVRHRPRVRRVTRVVRHVDTWSVFKIAVLFNIFLYAVCLTAGAMLWRVAVNTGTIENIERFFESFGWQTFQLKGGEIYHNAWIAGLFGVVGLTGLAVLAATMFNLITDLVGGVRVTVLEEEVTATEPRVVTWPRLLRPATPPHDPPPND